ncbi:MAG: hypothetical protein ACE5MM_08655 [Nitrospiraceae bacterium]
MSLSRGARVRDDADSGTGRSELLRVSRWQLIRWWVRVQATDYLLLFVLVAVAILLAIYFARR